MTILNAQIGQAGLAGVNPRIIYIDTNDTLATVTTAGYLNGLAEQNIGLQESDMALVTTKTSPSATSSQVAWLEISKSGSNWSLVAANSSIGLADGKIFVGNAGGVATAVDMSGAATIDNTGAVSLAVPNAKIIVGDIDGIGQAVDMSLDCFIDNTGAVSIGSNRVTTSKIADANVTLAKLAAGITPSHVVKFGAQYTTTGGAAAEAITVTGALVTDLAFVQLVDPGTAVVSVSFAVVTADTLTVTFSANPGNDAIINYQILRAAA